MIFLAWIRQGTTEIYDWKITQNSSLLFEQQYKENC